MCHFKKGTSCEGCMVNGCSDSIPSCALKTTSINGLHSIPFVLDWESDISTPLCVYSSASLEPNLSSIPECGGVEKHGVEDDVRMGEWEGGEGGGGEDVWLGKGSPMTGMRSTSRLSPGTTLCALQSTLISVYEFVYPYIC